MIRTKKFIFSILFSIVGYIILIIRSPVFILGLIPILIGLILFFSIKTSWKRKLSSISILVILLFIFVISGIISNGHYSCEEIHFSNNFNGRVRILYDKECGITPQRKGYWTVINVDTSSVILIKRKGRRVLTMTKFFFTDDSGLEKEIQDSEEDNVPGQQYIIQKHPPMFYNDRDINVQDYTLIRVDKPILQDTSLKKLNRSASVIIKQCKTD